MAGTVTVYKTPGLFDEPAEEIIEDPGALFHPSDRLPFPPRDYQLECIQAVEEELERVQSTLVVMATGTGKTVVFALKIKRYLKRNPHKRVLILVHRDELIQQAANMVRIVCPDAGVEIEQGDQWAVRKGSDAGALWRCGRVVVASVQSLWKQKRLNQFAVDEFGLIIVDEAHHAVKKAKTYWTIISYFVEAYVVGFTATPDRTDGRALGITYQTVAFVYDILSAIQAGWLVNVVQQFVTVRGYDLSKIKVKPGQDYTDEQIDAVIRQEKALQGMVVPAIELANAGGQRRQMIGFMPSVQAANEAAEIANRIQPGSAASITDKMDKDQRRAAIAAYRQGLLQYLFNYAVLTEGFDAPETRVILMARATKSRLVYAQQIGRGTRPHPSISAALVAEPDAAKRREIIKRSCKPAVLVIDPVGVSGHHKLMCDTLDILGGWFDREIIDTARKLAEQRGGQGRVTQDLEEAKRLVQEKRDEEKRLAEAAAMVERKKRDGIVLDVEYESRLVNPFDQKDISLSKVPQWAEGRPATDGQIALLKKWGIKDEELPKRLNFLEARKLMKKLFDRKKKKLCTWGQARILRKYGMDPERMPYDDAKRIIDQIAANGWKALI